MPTLRPMLADSTTTLELPRYANDDAWWAQLKADGHRFLIHINDGQIEVLNRAGQPKTTMVSHGILSCFEEFNQGEWVFDGELVGSQLLLFDLAVAQGHVKTTDPFSHRYHVLDVLYAEWRPDPGKILLLPVYRTPDEKMGLARSAEDERREGIMLRHRDGIYAPARRSKQLLKCKFVKDIDCIVTARATGGHDNVELTLLDPERVYAKNGILNVGSASAIGKKPEPQTGDVWEVRFLYVVDPAAPRLYQPRLMRKRTDKELHECTVDQIANAFTDKTITLKTRSDA